MLEKIKNSLLYRLPLLIKFYLRYRFRLRFKRPEKKQNRLYNIVLFTGHEQMEMLNVCLSTIYKNFESLPHIFIVTDQSLKSANCLYSIRWFPSTNITIIDSSECIEYHLDKGNHMLASFALKNPMGLKLAAILQIIALGTPILYTDTDVMWFRDPTSNLNELLNKTNFMMALSVDFQPAYDNDLIKKFCLSELSTPPYLCAGIILIKVLSSKQEQFINSFLPTLYISSGHFSEQTIFAYLNKLSGDFTLSKEQYVIEPAVSDFQVISRHYVGKYRHLFWWKALYFN